MSKRLGHAAIFAVGLAAILVLTADLRSHVGELLRHLRSGNWEVMTDRASIEQIVRVKYSDTGMWAINFAAASGQSFLLDGPGRKETVIMLGQQTLAESANLRFNSAPLQASYGAFLSQAILELALEPRTQGADVLKSLAIEFASAGGGTPRPLAPAIYARAQDLLSKLPRTSLLANALKNYNEFGPARGLDFVAFEVATTPSYDNPGAWNAQAQTLPQVGKCKAKVASRANPGQQADANFALMPRILEVNIDRPWMSDALVDSAFEQRGPLTAQYFQEGGELRVVPSRFWVLMPEAAWMEPVLQEDRAQIAGWGKENTCCRITCNNATFDLSPTSFRENRDMTYSAQRSDVQPLLYAVISRRRARN